MLSSSNLECLSVEKLSLNTDQLKVGKVGSPSLLGWRLLNSMEALENVARGEAQNNRAAVGAGGWRRSF